LTVATKAVRVLIADDQTLFRAGLARLLDEDGSIEIVGQATDGADAIIVRSTVDLAHSFGLRVVAEGVEDEATLHLLTALHCDLAQGYYLSRPIPAQELESWLRGTREETFA